MLGRRCSRYIQQVQLKGWMWIAEVVDVEYFGKGEEFRRCYARRDEVGFAIMRWRIHSVLRRRSRSGQTK